MENFEELIFKNELQNYIDENYIEEDEQSVSNAIAADFFTDTDEEWEGVEETRFHSPPPKRTEKFSEKKSSVLSSGFSGFSDFFHIDFEKIRDAEHEETFSDKLQRLIKERGEKNSDIYKRANIDRRHFSKICNHKNYQPSKLTVMAFALALKLNFEKTQELLASAGYTITKNNLADVIISFFIEKNFFDVDKINQYLYEYGQPILGS